MRHPEGEIIVRDLQQTCPPYISLDWISGAYVPPEQRSEEAKAALALGDELIAELKAVDHVLIATPMTGETTVETFRDKHHPALEEAAEQAT